MSMAGCQIIPIDHLQKFLEIFDKDLADKIQSKNFKGGFNPPYLMPFRVNPWKGLKEQHTVGKMDKNGSLEPFSLSLSFLNRV